MERITDWIHNVDHHHHSSQPEPSILLEPAHEHSDFPELNPLIHEWPEDRVYHDDPFAPFSVFYEAYFQHDDELALYLQATETELHAENATHNTPLLAVESVDRKENS